MVRWKKYWHWAVILLTMIGMTIVRLRPISKFTQDVPVFSGVDAYYHYRHVVYTVHNWPATLGTDLFTNYPQGSSSGQFGTLLDWVIATTAFVVGGGSPSEQTIAMTLLLFPVLCGVLVVIPTYYITETVWNKHAGVWSVVILGLQPGMFLRRSTVGFADHHSTEVLLHAIVVLFLVRYLKFVSEEPNADDKQRGISTRGLCLTLGVGAVLTLYTFVWPPALFLTAIIGTFVGLTAIRMGLSGQSVFTIGLFGTVMSAVQMSGFLISFDPSFGLSRIGYSHLLVVGCILYFSFGVTLFSIGKTRNWSERSFGAVVGAMCIPLFAAVFAFSQVIIEAIDALISRLGGNSNYIVEAAPFSILAVQPGVSGFDAFLLQFGLTLFTAIAFLMHLALYNDDQSSSKYFIAVWFVLLLGLMIQMVRFAYYIVLPVAVLNGYGIYRILAVEIDNDSPFTDTNRLGGYIAVLSILLVGVVIPVPLTFGAGDTVYATNSYQNANDLSPPRESWEDTLVWLKKNTPRTGRADGEGNSIGLTSTKNKYPRGSYGVLTLWDYGHWVSVISERPTYSNPLQQGRKATAAYFKSSSATEAEKKLSESRGMNPKYVIVDSSMVNYIGKYGGIVGRENMSKYGVLTFTEQAEFSGVVYRQPYYESMAVRLYRFHGSAVKESTMTVHWKREQTDDGVRLIVSDIKYHETANKASRLASQSNNITQGGIGPHPSETVSALSHYRLIHVSEQQSTRLISYQQFGQGEPQPMKTEPASVKVFERVQGATITGQAEPNATVKVSVELSYSENNTFVYKAYTETSSSGKFSITVPYATTEYRQNTSSGDTRTTVKANTRFTATVIGTNSTKQFHVPERAVTDGKIIQIGSIPVSDNKTSYTGSRPAT